MPSEREIAAAVWPTLLASGVGLLPFTVFTTYLVTIAESAGSTDAEVGSLRSLAGIGAVVAGVACAPLIGRVPPARMAAGALVLMGIGGVIGASSWLPALAVFCLLTGVANALLYPALSTAAADRFGDGPAAGRAATLVMTAQTLAATLGAPLIVLPTMWWGWQGDLIVIALVAFALAPLLFGFGRQGRPATGTDRLGYVAAFRTLARVPGAPALLMVSFGRTGAFMGHLAFLAALYDHRFGLTASVFAFVYGLSGASFFVGHLLAGRRLNLAASEHRAHRVLALSLGVALLMLGGVYYAPSLPVTLLCTSLLSVSHAVVAAAVVTLLVRRCTDVRGTALGLNTAVMSLGLSLGAAASGVGLAAGGYHGSAAVLAALTALALVAALSLRPAAQSAEVDR